MTETSRYLLFDLRVGTQKVLERNLGTLSRFRDFTNEKQISGTYAVQYVLADLVAQATNSTLIAKGHPNFQVGGEGGRNWFVAKYPRIIPDCRIFDSRTKSLEFIWNKFFNRSRPEMPTFVVKPKADSSFSYCALPKIKWDSTGDFSIFTDPFDSTSWLVLVLALILVSLLVHSSVKYGFSPAFFRTLSVMISAGTGSGARLIRYPKLFVLWMLTALVLVTFYTGTMTGQVIQPPSEEVLERLEDLEKNNFTLIFEKEFIFEVLKRTVMRMKGRGYFPENIRVLDRLLVKTVVQEDGNIATMMGGDGKFAVIIAWPYSMLRAAEASAWISKEFTKAKRKDKRKKCYIGKEMVDTGERYMAFLPPGSSLLAKASQKLLTSGILQRWEMEGVMVATSRRAQDRVRVKGQTTIVDIGTKVIAALRMEGKIVTIFFLWGSCLLTSLTCFIIESLLFCREQYTYNTCKLMLL